MQWGQGGYVGTHDSCVRSSRIANEYAWLLGQTHGPYIPAYIRITHNLTHLALRHECACIGTQAAKWGYRLPVMA